MDAAGVIRRRRVASRISHTLALVAGITGAAGVLLVPGRRIDLTLPLQVPLSLNTLTLDTLSAFFVLVISLGSISAALYAPSYLRSYDDHKPMGWLAAGYNLFVLSMLLVVTAGDLVLFLVAWELISTLSYLLVMTDHEQPAVRHAGFIYLVMAHAGPALITAAFLILARAAGTTDIPGLTAAAGLTSAAASLSPALRNLVFFFLLAGFGTRAGVIPLHVWLPRADPAAPSHVSALMSGVMVKTARGLGLGGDRTSPCCQVRAPATLIEARSRKFRRRARNALADSTHAAAACRCHTGGMRVAERSYPHDWTALLTAESARWLERGIISDSQREAILDLYPRPGAGARDRTILIFTVLGSLLLGAGVILFFAANWPSIPATAKVAVILAAVLGAYGAGFYLQYVRDDYPRLGHSLIFLGSLLYGAAIWLLAQIFHLDTHYPQGFLLWGVGLLPLVLVTLSRPVLYLTTVVLIIWTLTEQQGFRTYNFLFPVLALGALLPLARKARTALGEALALLALFLWFLVSFAIQVPGASPAVGLVPTAQVAILYGAALMTIALAELGEERAYLTAGGLLTLAGAYVLTFRATPAHPDVGAAPPSLFTGSPFLTAITISLLAAALAAGRLSWRRQPGHRLLLLPVLLTPIAVALGAGLLSSVPRMVVFNIVLFAGTIGLVALGVQRRRELLVNLGLAAFIIHVLTRHFDLFFPAMNRSLFFILGGVLLLGGGWLLERNRRRWMRDWGGDGHDR